MQYLSLKSNNIKIILKKAKKVAGDSYKIFLKLKSHVKLQFRVSFQGDNKYNTNRYNKVRFYLKYQDIKITTTKKLIN